MQMLVLSFSLVLFTTILFTSVTFVFDKRQLETLLAERLLGIVNSTTPSINAIQHENIFLNEEKQIEGKPDFNKIHALLDRVKRNNQFPIKPGVSPIYTMRPSIDFAKSGMLEFVVMTDKNSEGIYFTGAQIPAEPHHLRALKGESVATPIYQDQEGYWLSAVAPIRNAQGKTIALLQADYNLTYYYAQLLKLISQLMLGAVFSLLLALIVAYVAVRLLTNPMRQLLLATQELAKGNLKYRINQNFNNEFGILAQNFNIMAEKLFCQQQELKQHRVELEKLVQKRTQNLQAAYEKLEHNQTLLLQSEKMASIGQLAAGVAHEINNPIAFVANNATVLERYFVNLKEILHMHQRVLNDVSDHIVDAQLVQSISEVKTLTKQHNLDFMLDDITELLVESKEGMDRVTEIVMNLKSFSHIDESEAKYADVNRCLESTIKIVWNQLKYHCDLEKNFGDIPLVHCYPGQLNQVFMNLIVNAGHAIRDKGKIIITTRLVDRYVEILVEDTGHGIAPENLKKLFDPFFTTKPVGKGTGLGLSISYNIIKKHNGTISVESELEKGTCFIIRLPVDGIEDEEINSSLH
ncbi:MAG: hypothetical protein Tsb005_17180 [Gammaproteobacteria bacterium]